jgi:hypothetical protein
MFFLYAAMQIMDLQSSSCSVPVSPRMVLEEEPNQPKKSLQEESALTSSGGTSTSTLIFNTKVPTDERTLDYGIVAKYPFRVVSCLAGGAYPILMHISGSIAWVCKSEKTVSTVMLLKRKWVSCWMLALMLFFTA